LTKKRALVDRLGFRLGVGLCAGAALILLATGVWNIRLQRDHLTNMVAASADRSAQIIRRSTHDAMLANRPEQVHRLLEVIGEQEGIERIRIFDPSGRVRISTHPAEIGLARSEVESCRSCHDVPPDAGQLSCCERSSILRTDQGRSLGVIAPILNEPDCWTAACHAHPKSQEVLGVLDVQLSLGAVDAQLATSERQMAFALIVTVGAMLLLTGLLVWRMIILPVRRLTEGTAAVAAGGPLTKVPVTASDEMGELAISWNAMVDELGRARHDIEAWSTTLEARVQEKTDELETAHEKILLSAKMASLGKLAAVVAHEINNPLAGIHTYARLLRKKMAKTDSEETGRILDMVADEAARCGGIVRNLLLFSRGAGTRFVEVDLGALLDRCALLVRHQAELQEIQIDVDVDPGLPAVLCDQSQIQQLVLALAMNAIEAMPDGGLFTLRLAPLVSGADPDEIVLTVTDTGCGIEPDDLAHIFEPFYTRKEEGKGVGLGLAVVYGIVKRHGGQVQVNSTPGVGTTFTVQLPVRASETEDAETYDQTYDQTYGEVTK